MTTDDSARGLRAGAPSGIGKSVALTTDRASWLVVVGALLLLIIMRSGFRGALGD